jgi:mono/diheme cytochrome c family protein
MRYIISIALILAALPVILFGIAGSRGRLSRVPPIEVFPDMDRQAKLRPQEPNPFFANGVSSQLPPPGTVARSQPFQTTAGPVYRFEDSPVNTGLVTGTTNFVAVNPLPVDEALLRRGRERFDIYCAPCHGRLGDGNGITKKLGVMPAVANLHDQRLVAMPDGEIFNTVTHGKGVMGAYGPLMPVEDRWAVIAYVRALQLSWLGSPDELPADEQSAFKK